VGEKLDLVGVAEIALMLGISRQRVFQLVRDHEDFPLPVAELIAGKIWLRSDIDAWARAWDRRPGRRMPG
jgi:predicted DNA-binding transcriptional regulator AlpA